MEHLPKKAKRIFQLNRLEGRSISEIAKLLNLSEKAIEYHLTTSVKHLKLLIKDTIVILCYASLYCLHLLQ
jgi:RNA polymerase sigma factor (sigma-70 family)